VQDPAADHPGWREVAYLALARVLSAQGSHREALALLGRLLQSAESEGRQGSVIANLVLQALVNQAAGNGTTARVSLERALLLAEPQGYVRTFVDEGEPMRVLLQAYAARPDQMAPGGERQALALAYARRLLAAFPVSGAGVLFALAGGVDGVEALSQRELEVLQLAATGASNSEIASELFIALPTVKKHMSHILLKLDTRNRVQAISRARDLGLLP
jgi:LuxR family maltose regulon positive regulatory protein